MRKTTHEASQPQQATTQHVMAGFADADRAWIEAMSAKPETLLDLQGRFMQEQMKLWMRSLDPKAHGNGGEAAEIGRAHV